MRLILFIVVYIQRAEHVVKYFPRIISTLCLFEKKRIIPIYTKTKQLFLIMQFRKSKEFIFIFQ